MQPVVDMTQNANKDEDVDMNLAEASDAIQPIAEGALSDRPAGSATATTATLALATPSTPSSPAPSAAPALDAVLLPDTVTPLVPSGPTQEPDIADLSVQLPSRSPSPAQSFVPALETIHTPSELLFGPPTPPCALSPLPAACDKDSATRHAPSRAVSIVDVEVRSIFQVSLTYGYSSIPSDWLY